MSVSDTDPATLASEMTRYLEAIEIFRSLDLDPRWRSEAEELGRPTPALQMQPPTRDRCADPVVRINGRTSISSSRPD